MRNLFLGVVVGVIIALFPATASAQSWAGETEGRMSESGDHFSQFVFFDWEDWTGRFRLFLVEGATKRFVAGIGPTVRFGGTRAKLHFGGTTNREVMLAGTIFSRVWGHNLIHVMDGKVSTDERSSQLYQKTFLALSQSGSWQARVDHLLVGHRQIFLRLGGEYRWRGFYVAPHYDPLNEKWGAWFGYRFSP